LLQTTNLIFAVGVFQRGESLWAQISDGSGRHPPTTVGVRKLR